MVSLLRALVRSGEIIGAVGTWMIMLVVVYDVAVRALGHPTLWALEVSGYLMVAVSILAAGETLRRGGHFEVRLFVDLLPDGPRRVVDRFVDAVSAAFVLAMTYGGFQLVAQSYAFGFRSPTLLGVPLFIPHAVLAAGLTLLSIAYLGRIVQGFDHTARLRAGSESSGSAV